MYWFLYDRDLRYKGVKVNQGLQIFGDRSCTEDLLVIRQNKYSQKRKQKRRQVGIQIVNMNRTIFSWLSA